MAATTVCSMCTLAQQDSVKQSTLDEVIITATKSPLKQSQTGKVVSVIDQATLQRNAGKSVTEIINYQAGVFINGANNALGTNQDIYFRGANTGNVLILIDGIPTGDPSQINNTFDLNNIAVSQIERIEILKGAQSTLWGSDAVAGVINIITKKGGPKKIGAQALLTYGSYNTWRGNAGINGHLGGFTYNVNYGHVQSDGFSTAFDSSGNKNFDDDGFKQNTLQATVGYKFSPVVSLRGLYNGGKYTADIDAGAFADDKDFTMENTNELYSLDLAITPAKFNLHFINSLEKARRLLMDDSTSVGGFAKFSNGSYKGVSFISELVANFTFSKKASLVAGVQSIFQTTDQKYLSISDFGPYETALGDSAKTWNHSVYASFLLTDIAGLNTEIGFRVNNHSIYGSNATYTFNPSYNIDDNTRVFVNISSGYKVPSLYQLYSEYGNKELNPERSANYELGVQTFSNNKKNSFRITGFKRDIKNLIIFYTDPNTFASYYINRAKQNDYGFELESNISIGSIGNWVNNITYVDGEGTDDNVKIKNLFRRPNFILNSLLTLQPVKGLTVTPGFRFVGTRLKGAYDAGPVTQPSYYTIDFYTGYDFNKTVRIFLDLRNITDQEYFDVVGFNSRKFNITAGVSVSF
jgi:vitamin B12 transporter